MAETYECIPSTGTYKTIIIKIIIIIIIKKNVYFAQFWNPFVSTDGSTGAYRLKDKVSVG